MRYANGEDVRLWDRVQVWEDCFGIVVCAVDADEYGHGFPREHWSYLERGVMVATDRVGLIHFDDPEAGFDLKVRGSQPSADEWAPYERASAAQGGGPQDV